MKRKLFNIFIVMIISIYALIPFINVNAETSYNITTSKSGNGTITVQTSAEENEEITVNIEADDGWRIQSILIRKDSVSGSDGQIIGAIYGGTVKEQDTYTFTMPADDVTISVAYISKTKEVFIDNTVDKSRSYITGVVIKKNLKTGETSEETVYSNSADVSYGMPKTAKVQEMIDEAYSIAESKAKEISSYVTMSMKESTSKVWDNRTYTTQSDGDATLIGDADYLIGSYGVNNVYTITHIASGDYGKSTYYVVTAYAEYTSEEEYSILDGADGKYIIDSNKDLTIRANGNIDNFVELKVDGEVLDTSNYKVVSGSTIATLYSSYLNTLSVGTHTLTFVYNDGSVSTNFIVSRENVINNPNTSDNVINYIVVLMLSLSGFIGSVVYFKKVNS